ncbi:MAG: nucleotidyltransferase substrate binding protein [Candidatus Cloacimonadota bacterium]|nr:nucleotidyltransferase substrate binding protein [Candidatus Cloacimonadota bacterium]
MKKDQKIITKTALYKAISAINLVEASLEYIKPYKINQYYTPREREPYDALCDRFIRAIEISLKYFRSYEKLMYGENSETIRDLLNRMEKLEIISSVILWMQMRDVRNRIVHDYLPEEIRDMYDEIMGIFGNELLQLKRKLVTNKIDDF